MKQYVWLNPVVLSLYEEKELFEAIRQKGFEIIICRENHLEKVRQKYEKKMMESDRCVMDMRCPAAADYVRSRYGEKDAVFPDIQPILIHCAQELSSRWDGKGTIFVTTPCKELRDRGNGLRLPGIQFLTWNEFSEINGLLDIPKQQLDSSPIPPGFFSECEGAADPLSSKEKIDQFFGEEGYRHKRVAEMLYCTDGCHNGNGV